MNSGAFDVFNASTATIIGNVTNPGFMDAEAESTLHIVGDLSNSGGFFTSFYGGTGTHNTLTISGKVAQLISEASKQQ